MLEDTLHIVDLDRKLQGTEVQVGGYDLVWCGGPVKGPKGAPNASHSNLGSSNLRETNFILYILFFRKLFKHSQMTHSIFRAR